MHCKNLNGSNDSVNGRDSPHTRNQSAQLVAKAKKSAESKPNQNLRSSENSVVPSALWNHHLQEVWVWMGPHCHVGRLTNSKTDAVAFPMGEPTVQKGKHIFQESGGSSSSSSWYQVSISKKNDSENKRRSRIIEMWNCLAKPRYCLPPKTTKTSPTPRQYPVSLIPRVVFQAQPNEPFPPIDAIHQMVQALKSRK